MEGSINQRRSRLAQSPLPGTLSTIALSRQLLRPAPQLLLKRYIPRALHGSHESREILLLRLDDSDALFLQPQRRIQEVADVLLTGLLRRELHPQLPAGLAFLSRQLSELRSKSRVRLGELRHLCIGQSNPCLGELGYAFAELLLENRTAGVR
jgi:hypothetical protein